MQVRTLSGPVQMHLYRREVSRYLGKISGPLLDRMDICVEAQAVTYEEMEGKAENESSASIRARVEAARAIQRERFKGLSIRCNGEMGGGQIRRFCPLNKEESEFMEHIFFQPGNFHPDVREDPEGGPDGGGSGRPGADPHKGSQRGRILCADPAAYWKTVRGGS